MKDSVKKLLFAIIYAIIAVNAHRVFSGIIKPVIPNDLVRSVASETFFAVLAVIGIVLFHKASALKIKTEGLGTGLKAGLLIILINIFIMLSHVLEIVVLKRGAFTASGTEIVMFICHMLLIGITEEILFRAMLQNLMLNVTGEDTAVSARNAILLTGVCFGMIHLFNIFSGLSVMSAFDQAMMAIPMGAIQGAVYFRSKNNLLAAILLHAFVDASGLIASLSGATAADTVNAVGSHGSIRIIGFLLYFAIALFLMRKSVMEKAIEDRKTSNK